MHCIFNANINNMLAGAGTLILGPLFLTISLIFSCFHFHISQLDIRVEVLSLNFDSTVYRHFQ
jgi:hypothetical protein